MTEPKTVNKCIFQKAKATKVTKPNDSLVTNIIPKSRTMGSLLCYSCLCSQCP